jgi:hypothetical protein
MPLAFLFFGSMSSTVPVALMAGFIAKLAEELTNPCRAWSTNVKLAETIKPLRRAAASLCFVLITEQN